jgi:hypothetical protein
MDNEREKLPMAMEMIARCCVLKLASKLASKQANK